MIQLHKAPVTGLADDRRFARVLALSFLFSALYFTLTHFNSVDCWWHMRGAEYFWQHGAPLLNDTLAIPGEAPLLALYPNLLPGTMFLLAFSAGSFLGLNLLRIAVFMIFLAVLTWSIFRRRKDPSLLLSAVAVLVLAMAGMVVLRPDLFNYAYLVLWLLLLEQARRRPQRLGPLAGLAVVEILWVNSHPLFFYYGLGLGLFSAFFIAGGAKVTLPRFRGVQVPSRLLFLAVIGLGWLLNPLGWQVLQGLPVNMLRADYAAGSMRSTAAALVSVNTALFFLLAIALLAARPWRRLASRADRLWFFGALLLVAVPALLYQRALPFLPIFLIVASALAPEPRSLNERPRRRLWAQALLAGLCVFLMLERLYLLSPRLIGRINSALHVQLAEEFLPAGIGVTAVLPEEQVREVEILNALGCRGNLVSNHLGLCSAVTWLARGLTPYWYGHAALINARSEELRAFFIALESSDDAVARRFIDRYRIDVVALTNYTSRFLAAPARFLEHLVPVYFDPYLTVCVPRGRLRDETRRELGRFFSAFSPGERDRQAFDPVRQVEQYKLLWLSARMHGLDGERFLLPLRRAISMEEWRSFRRQADPLIEAVRRLQPERD
ncbi:MAG: hypothetical protein MUC72_02215 [Acidobacteria bacterium]|jgi:hypothetical protein|nr:hypothetical protein [Acidobacteriota bacterium]